MILAWNGNDSAAILVRIAAILPALGYALARRIPKPPAEVAKPAKIRGTHLGSQNEADLRAEELTAAVELTRPLFLGQWPVNGLRNLALLVVYAVAGFWIALALTRKRFRN